ncbi:HTTM domain-containing protein [Halopiger xanaduensis]|uniref:HTTM domain protein n=1 Tax=Halopiger xanaduensis (strain DSM 18323 / JCM 14033 / SH-6) TaxID=797210 RepID=F8D6F3_HALXS|nr:HTTM domain-containing protein [Halopiger xanaduensis]AEH36540.1 HTTM domain protein [Halopiger xanaduensis SH-6]
MDWSRSPSATRPNLSAVLDRLSIAIQRRVAIDPRALAAFRIAIGTLLILDLALRARNLGTFYTDAGVLPLRALFSDYSPVYSLHAISGAAWVQALLFAVAGAFALALLLGYRTRLATIVSWLLLLSLHARNPMVLNSGDTLLRMLLFWGMFLPLGREWSIDARRLETTRGGEDGTVDETREPVTDESGPSAGDSDDESGMSVPGIVSVPTMAILLQVQLMYLTNAVHKTRSDKWMGGDAVVHIFQADHLTILLGDVLADQHALLELFTYAWIAVILLSPLLLLLTGVWRAAFASVVIGMHLGMATTLQIGLFPLISVGALLLFYPPVVWETATALATRIGIAAPLRRGLDRLQRTAPRVPLPDAPAVPAATDLPATTRTAIETTASRSRVLFSTVIPWLLLVLVVLSNAEAVDYADVPEVGDEVLETVNADQSWRMFAPNPTSTTRWLVAPADLEDGSQVDAFGGGEVDWDRPPSADELYDTARERKYVSNMRYADNENHRSYFANYLCDRWNRSHETGLENVTIYGLTDNAGPYDDEPDIAKYKKIEYDCSGPFVQNG